MLVKRMILSALLLSSSAFAQGVLETSIVDGSQVMEYMAKHFSASYHGEFYGVRRNVDSENAEEKKINDFKFMHNPTLIFKPTENWQFLATAEFKFSDQPSEAAGADYPNGFYRSLFTLTRKNILTQKENGVQFDAGIGRRQFNTGGKQQPEAEFALASYGNDRVFSTLSKTIGKADVSFFSQYLFNDYKKSSKNTWKHSLEFIPSVNIPLTSQLSYFFNDDIVLNTAKSNQVDKNVSISHEMNLAVFTFQFNDKVNTYYQLKYLHSEGFSRAFASQEDYFLNYVGLGYAFTPKTSVTFEVGSELAHARDGRDVFSKKLGMPELALYVDAAI